MVGVSTSAFLYPTPLYPRSSTSAKTMCGRVATDTLTMARLNMAISQPQAIHFRRPQFVQFIGGLLPTYKLVHPGSHRTPGPCTCSYNGR